MADRLTDRDVESRLAALDDLLGRLEQTPGATAATGLDAVRALTEVYGEALARLMTCLAGVPSASDAAAADDLVGHLLVLHGIHPQPVTERVGRALDGIRPYVRSHGGEVELAGITDGVARVRLAGTCDGCPSSAGTLELVVREAVLAAAPELSGVQPVRTTAANTPLIPLDQVRRRPEPRPGGAA
jgi:Fe-S cluster biogenesis protein NfuA